MSHQDEFVRALSEKLLSYAVGRVVESYDLPAVRQIARDAAAHDDRWSALISAVVRSTPFTMAIVQSESRSGQPVTGVASQ